MLIYRSLIIHHGGIEEGTFRLVSETLGKESFKGTSRKMVSRWRKAKRVNQFLLLGENKMLSFYPPAHNSSLFMIHRV